jgi:uncharacterized protein YggE
MRKSWKLAGGSGAVLAAVAGLLLAMPAAAQEAPRTVGPPEAALTLPGMQIDLGVESVARTATGARSAAELAAHRVVRALAGSGIPLRQVRIGETFLVPEYEDPGVVPITTIRDDRRIVAYRAVIGLSVEVPSSPHAGLLVDLARGAGATRSAAVRLGPAMPAGD